MIRHFSLVRVIGWAVALPLAYVYGWIYSVAFVSLCSIYANIASDFAAWRADSNPELAEIIAKLDAILELLQSRKA